MASARAVRCAPSDRDDALPRAAPRDLVPSIPHPSRLGDEAADIDWRAVPVISVAPHYLKVQMRCFGRRVPGGADKPDHIALLNLQSLHHVRSVAHEVRVIVHVTSAGGG